MHLLCTLILDQGRYCVEYGIEVALNKVMLLLTVRFEPKTDPSILLILQHVKFIKSIYWG